MMQSCVVIPVYKARMSETEMASFRQALSVFGKSQRTVVIATFSSLDVSRYEEEASICGVSLLFEHFPSDCFASIHSYNCLMLDPAFYGRFSGYDYILIFQLDAWVFEDRLDEWCAKGYDYVGAPLFAPGRSDLQCARTGNGGFSLRRVYVFRKALSSSICPFAKRPSDPYISFNKKMLYFAMLLFSGWCNAVRGFLTHWVDEDRFFSYTLLGTKYEMKVPSPQEALDFAFDMHPSVCFALNGNCLPMGCHQWPAFYDFWEGYIASLVSQESCSRAPRLALPRRRGPLPLNPRADGPLNETPASTTACDNKPSSDDMIKQNEERGGRDSHPEALAARGL